MLYSNASRLFASNLPGSVSGPVLCAYGDFQAGPAFAAGCGTTAMLLSGPVGDSDPAARVVIVSGVLASRREQ